MLTDERDRKKLELKRLLMEMDAPDYFFKFLHYVNPIYKGTWFHKAIAEHCQSLMRGDIRNLMVFVPPQHGKALAVDTPVLTANRGWCRHGDLRFGDYVFAPNGKRVMVEAVTEHYPCECSVVEFACGKSIIAANEHEWGCYIPDSSHVPKYYPRIETQEIWERRKDRNPYLLAALPLKYTCKELPIPQINKHFIKSIKPYGESVVNCIQVEGGYYLVGKELRPTHNSEIVSKMFPAWAFGRNPNLKIVGCSYSATLAQQFSRSIQRVMDSTEYQAIFPNTKLNGSNVRTVTRGYLRNVDMFEIVNARGFYKAQGVGGSLTGTPVDIAIIDDPVKDAMEAYSPIYRERVWDWYTSVLMTRLHNESRQLFIMTRWHEDDLAGRILQREADKWTVLSIPAIRESMDDGNEFDPRQEGEALWPERHSLDRLLEAKMRSVRFFSALYQQHPTIEGGNIIKNSWFKYISPEDFNHIHKREAIIFFIDTAFTEKTANDPTGIIGTCKIGNDLYITCAEKVNMKFPDLVRHIPEYVTANGYTRESSIRIEPKANGISVIDQLAELTRLNVTATPSPQESKETRLNAASPFVECGRVYLVKGVWNGDFVTEVCGFPARPHDEYVDLLCYAINHFHDTADTLTDEQIFEIGFL